MQSLLNNKLLNFQNLKLYSLICFKTVDVFNSTLDVADKRINELKTNLRKSLRMQQEKINKEVKLKKS